MSIKSRKKFVTDSQIEEVTQGIYKRISDLENQEALDDDMVDELNFLDQLLFHPKDLRCYAFQSLAMTSPNDIYTNIEDTPRKVSLLVNEIFEKGMDDFIEERSKTSATYSLTQEIISCLKDDLKKYDTYSVMSILGFQIMALRGMRLDKEDVDFDQFSQFVNLKIAESGLIFDVEKFLLEELEYFGFKKIDVSKGAGLEKEENEIRVALLGSKNPELVQAEKIRERGRDTEWEPENEYSSGESEEDSKTKVLPDEEAESAPQKKIEKKPRRKKKNTKENQSTAVEGEDDDILLEAEKENCAEFIRAIIEIVSNDKPTAEPLITLLTNARNILNKYEDGRCNWLNEEVSKVKISFSGRKAEFLGSEASIFVSCCYDAPNIAELMITKGLEIGESEFTKTLFASLINGDLNLFSKIFHSFPQYRESISPSMENLELLQRSIEEGNGEMTKQLKESDFSKPMQTAFDLYAEAANFIGGKFERKIVLDSSPSGLAAGASGAPVSSQSHRK